MWKFLRTQYQSACAKYQIPAIIIFGNHRSDLMITKIRNCIHMCDKSKCRNLFFSFRRRKFSIQIALIIKDYLCQAKFLHFFFQLPRQIKLTHRRRNCLTLFITRRTHCHIVDQSFPCFHNICSFVSI